MLCGFWASQRQVLDWECDDAIRLDERPSKPRRGVLALARERTSQHTGVPLTMTTRRSVIMLLTRFINETAAWQWDAVPGRVLFTRGDIPKIPKTLPRFIPEHELAALMTAVDALTDPYQHAALIVAR